MKDFDTRLRTIGDIRWHFYESTTTPRQHTPTVVMVPGLGEGDYMAPHARLLAPHWPVQIVDMPGFGRSRGPRRLVTVDQFGAAFDEFLRATKAKPTHVIASSFGCQIAAAAAQKGAPIGRLVLVSPTYDRTARSVLGQLRRWIPTMVVEPPSLALGLAKSYLHCGVRTPITAFFAGLRDHIEDRLPDVAAPTLVVHGGRDRIVPGDWASELVRRLPNGRLATIDGFAHTLDYAAPARLAAITLPFLSARP